MTVAVTDYVTSSQAEELITWRHEFHQHPELGFSEHRTSARVVELLKSFGVQVFTDLAGTGVVGVLQQGNSTRSIGLRADLDALPIQEQNNFAYRSVHPQVMHACGHDGHTTMLLGAARYLARHGHFNGRVVFIFQPNEEHGEGAKAMLGDGLFERFDVDAVYGLHNIPGMPVGQFATRTGPVTASESLFEIDIHAQGGHAALPHMGVDAIVVGAQIVNALQTIVSRKLNPGLNGVVSVTGFETDGKRNVLPGHAKLTGDARALTAETNTTIEQRMRDIVSGVTAAHGVSAQVHYQTIFPETLNAPAAVEAATNAAASVVGEDAVNKQCEPKLFSEDFAHLSHARPGCYMLMGNGQQGASAKPLHSADYDFNDEALVPGSAYWVTLVEQQLSS